MRLRNLVKTYNSSKEPGFQPGHSDSTPLNHHMTLPSKRVKSHITNDSSLHPSIYSSIHPFIYLFFQQIFVDCHPLSSSLYLALRIQQWTSKVRSLTSKSFHFRGSWEEVEERQHKFLLTKTRKAVDQKESLQINILRPPALYFHRAHLEKHFWKFS